MSTDLIAYESHLEEMSKINTLIGHKLLFGKFLFSPTKLRVFISGNRMKLKLPLACQTNVFKHVQIF